jgi:hypothetical protein
MTIGSFQWRFVNYGILPSIKFLFERINSKWQKVGQNESTGIDELFTSLGIDSSDFDLNFVSQELEKHFALLKNELKTHQIKNVFDRPSFTRILILAVLIKSKKYKLLIESGTQNGISTSLIKSLMISLDAPVNIVSFDVVDHPKVIESGVRYHVLSQPIRKNFKIESLKLDSSEAIFFHDSDHSKENMDFELDWAWNVLKVPCLLSDDVEGNFAFTNFCKKNKVNPYYFKLDHGPLVGLVIRK